MEMNFKEWLNEGSIVDFFYDSTFSLLEKADAELQKVIIYLEQIRNSFSEFEDAPEEAQVMSNVMSDAKAAQQQVEYILADLQSKGGTQTQHIERKPITHGVDVPNNFIRKIYGIHDIGWDVHHAGALMVTIKAMLQKAIERMPTLEKSISKEIIGQIRKAQKSLENGFSLLYEVAQKHPTSDDGMKWSKILANNVFKIPVQKKPTPLSTSPVFSPQWLRDIGGEERWRRPTPHIYQRGH